MKMDAMLTNHDVSHFLKSTLWLTPRFLHQYIKTKLDSKELQIFMWSCQIKEKTKAFQTPFEKNH